MKTPYNRIVFLLTFTFQQNQTLLAKETADSKTADSKINSEKNNTKSLLPYSIHWKTLVGVPILCYFSFLKWIRNMPQQKEDKLQVEQEQKRRHDQEHEQLVFKKNFSDATSLRSLT